MMRPDTVSALMAQPSHENPHVALVALASWLLPGAGYWLLGQRARALTIGITIVVLFVLGLLIGGVRLIEVPGWGDHGRKLVLNSDHAIEEERDSQSSQEWVMTSDPLAEIRNKPWFVAQILAGPIDIAASWGSVMASRPRADGSVPGVRSHSRTNELGVLYTAVAGMLNLLAIMDAAHRAARHQDGGK